MELLGSLFLVLALGVLVALFLAVPFLRKTNAGQRFLKPEVQQREHVRSSLLAERDRVLNALQELDFDHALGKVPEEEYPAMRADLLRNGANVLRQLEAFETESQAASAEDRIEAAVAARRADAGRAVSGQAEAGSAVRQVEPVAETLLAEGAPNGHSQRGDEIEELIASRKRVRQETAAGFCPRCGKPVQKSDKFCAKCGTEV
jgi:hypothetical protein